MADRSPLNVGDEVWVRAHIHIRPAHDKGDVHVVITDAKASNHSIELHPEHVVQLGNDLTWDARRNANR